MINTASKWIGYLEHQTEEALGFYTMNVGKGGCTIFSYIIRKYYPRRNFTGLPWCATFLHAMFLETFGKERSKHLLGKPHPGTRVLARRMKRRGRLRPRGYIPSSCDIAFYHNGDGRISHCGIVIAVDGENVTTIEGNTVDPSGVFDKDSGGAVAKRVRNFMDESLVCWACIIDG